MFSLINNSNGLNGFKVENHLGSFRVQINRNAGVDLGHLFLVGDTIYSTVISKEDAVEMIKFMLKYFKLNTTLST